MDIKNILTTIYNFIVGALKHFEVFPEEFFDLIEGLLPEETE